MKSRMTRSGERIIEMSVREFLSNPTYSSEAKSKEKGTVASWYLSTQEKSASDRERSSFFDR